HVSADVKPNALNPIYVGWDFGEEKPAIVFAQWIRSIGAFRIVLSIKGKEMVLEDLAPKVLEIQKREFPGADFYEWCDPTGAKGNGGMRNTPVRLLHDHGVLAKYEPNANDADVRYGAIQAI